MSDIKLFSVKGEVRQLPSSEVVLERELQNLIEQNMETFFGVRLLRSEYVISDGRMDSIGLDENNCPVIFEYKRSVNENVINQGLFYLDWLLDHKADFRFLVQESLGSETASLIEWSAPCVICVASGFTRYDVHAVKQMQRNIRLVQYRKYGSDLILFEYLNAPAVKPVTEFPSSGHSGVQKSHLEKLSALPSGLRNLYESVCGFIESLGDDVTANQLKMYLAYKKTQNIVCIEVYSKMVLLYLKLNPDTVKPDEGFIRDMRNVGHNGTGDVQVAIRTTEDFEKAKPLLIRAYMEN